SRRPSLPASLFLPAELFSEFKDVFRRDFAQVFPQRGVHKVGLSDVVLCLDDHFDAALLHFLDEFISNPVGL
ncbi:hypothetical protein L4Q51_006908, partial [Pseudomonas aeruginosa]